jgi:transcriptional regulator with XRE-family HTH domain
MQLGEKIKELRTKEGFSLGEMASKLSVPETLLCDWENNLAIPNGENILKICETFHLDSGYFLEEKNSFQNKKINTSKIVLAFTSFLASILLISFSFVPIFYDELILLGAGIDDRGNPIVLGTTITVYYSIFDRLPWLAYISIVVFSLSFISIVLCLFKRNKKTKMAMFSCLAVSFLLLITLIISSQLVHETI